MYMRTIPKFSESDKKRFWSKVSKGKKNDCWEWKAARLKSGYGVFMMPGNLTLRAHRIVSFLVDGPISEDLHVCHKCDNPSCCNPDHLFRGTRFDNLRDCGKRGRTCLQRYPWLARGENNNSAKLTEAQVQEIRKKEMSITQTASRFGISVTNVKNIRAGRSWRHLL